MKDKKKCMDRFAEDIKGTIFFQMHRIHTALFRVANKIFQGSEIPVKVEQLPVLMCVYQAELISQQEIADVIKRDKSSVQRSLVGLSKKGFLEIRPNSEDKRKNDVTLTAAGEFVAKQLTQMLKTTEEELFKYMQHNDKEVMIESLKNVADSLENIQH